MNGNYHSGIYFVCIIPLLWPFVCNAIIILFSNIGVCWMDITYCKSASKPTNISLFRILKELFELGKHCDDISMYPYFNLFIDCINYTIYLFCIH